MDIVEEENPQNMMAETKNENAKEFITCADSSSYFSIEALLLHLAPSLALISGLWIIPLCYGFNLIDHPLHTLRITSVSTIQINFPLCLLSIADLCMCQFNKHRILVSHQPT